MKQLIVSIVVTTVISVILTMFVMASIKNYHNAKVETEVVSDTVSTKVDTLTFEQEMAIVDSLVKEQDGVVYKSLDDVPDVEYIHMIRSYQTLVRHPNGMPKILAKVSSNDNNTEKFIRGDEFLFLDEHGRRIAIRRSLDTFGKWRCFFRDYSTYSEHKFYFNNPNRCRSVEQNLK